MNNQFLKILFRRLTFPVHECSSATYPCLHNNNFCLLELKISAQNLQEFHCWKMLLYKAASVRNIFSFCLSWSFRVFRTVTLWINTQKRRISQNRLKSLTAKILGKVLTNLSVSPKLTWFGLKHRRYLKNIKDLFP